MGQLIQALLNLQSVERQLAHVGGRLRVRKNAVTSQQKQIDQLRSDWQALHERVLERRIEADRRELDLKSKEQEVSKLRTALNTAKTNKEYAAILTQMNTIKADDARLEEDILKVIQQADDIKADADKLQEQIGLEEKQLEEVEQTNAREIDKLTGMLEELSAKRAEAAKFVPPEALTIFERIACKWDSDAMAPVEIHGRKPPYDYICGGCFMSLNAEHANALSTRDEIRRCDNCGRILYLAPEEEKSRT